MMNRFQLFSQLRVSNVLHEILKRTKEYFGGVVAKHWYFTSDALDGSVAFSRGFFSVYDIGTCFIPCLIQFLSERIFLLFTIMYLNVGSQNECKA